MMTVNQRITKIITELYSGNKRAFSNAIGVSAAVIENIVGKRQSSPSFDITNKILLSLDNINAEWLIIGKGQMLKIEDSTHTLPLEIEKKEYREETRPRIPMDAPNVIEVSENPMSVYTLTKDYYSQDKQLIPLYDLSAAAGLNTLFSDQSSQIPLDYIRSQTHQNVMVLCLFVVILCILY